MTAPVHTDIVLVGGGHAHVFVLKAFGMKPVPGVRLTLITKELDAPYSGMLPGMVAGHYTHDECHINLVRLARFAGVRLIHGQVDDVDATAKTVGVKDRPPIAYDLLSIDVGITPDLSGIEGAATHALAVKPVSQFADKWRLLEARLTGCRTGRDTPVRVTVVGGGAAGFELALAADHRLRTLRGAGDGRPVITLVAGGQLLSQHNERARRRARSALESAGVTLVEGVRVTSVSDAAVRLNDGSELASEATLVATGAQAPAWFSKTGLALNNEGYIAVRTTLQMHGNDDVFAVGDCATIIDHPRPKSGVFAVRQGPPLARNLRARALGRSLEEHRPQSRFLTLLSTGKKSAIAAWGPLAISGDWVWTWKDYIDRQFMDRFDDLPGMTGGSGQGPADTDMRCRGCAAKVGPTTLANALDRVSRLDGRSDDARPGRRDDAVVIDDGGEQLTLETVDFFRSFWDDPYVFGEIAANHALSDIYAMGGSPDRALAIAMLPHAASAKVGEDLFQLLAGARVVLDREGVELAGGHSCEGAEMGVGFFASGHVARERLARKSALVSGLRLILTKPIGTGIVLAAEMRGKATVPAIEAALNSMRRSNRESAAVLAAHGARAMTDITGFGLGGHALEMLCEPAVTITLDLAKVPTLPTAIGLAKSGLASSLLPENAALECRLILPGDKLDAADRALLFDPQTSGGLLACVPADEAESCLAELTAGPAPEAAIVGTISDALSAESAGLEIVGHFA